MLPLSARGALAGLVCALLALIATAAALAGGLSPNPADDPRLLGKPIEEFRYDEARRCKDRPPRGMRALQTWLEENVRGESWGIMRCERLSGSSYSLHAEGRAIDWHLDARRSQGPPSGEEADPDAAGRATATASRRRSRGGWECRA